MILRSRLILLFIIISLQCSGSQTYIRKVDGTLNEDVIRRIQSLFRSPYQFHPQHRSYRNNPIYSDEEGPPLRSRKLQLPGPSYVVEPEEREIDSIVETVSPKHEFHVRQQEVAPAVEQTLPKLDTKQQRVPQHQLYTQEQRQNPQIVHKDTTSDLYFIALVAGCSIVAVFGVIAAGFCWYKLQKNAKAAAEADYPAYGVTGPSQEHISPPNGDRKLAQSAQMYHYQHQKQQMIAIEKAGSDRHVSTSDLDSEEENEEGDYTVYECPGLASTGEMEVKNPLFQDESTPASPPVTVRELDK